MKVQKSKAVGLFVALGLKNADKWNDQRLATKLGKIKEMVDEDVELEAEAGDLLKEVMDAAEAGEGFEIEEEGTEVDAPAERAEGEPQAEKAAKPKKEKKAKQPKPKKEKAQRRTVHYICGELIGKHGVEAGVTKEFVKELTDELKKDDQQRFGIDMKTSWHAIAGYTGFEGDAVGVNTKMETRPKAAGKLYKEMGLDAKVKDLIAVLNEKYGKANDTQSTYTLRNALGAIKGFLAATTSKEESQTTSD